MEEQFLACLTVPELKERLVELGLPRSGKKQELIARLAGAAGVLTEKKANNNCQEDVAGPSGSAGPCKKLKTGGVKVGNKAGADGAKKQLCLESCKPGKKSGCAQRSFKKACHEDTKACYEVERMIRAMGMDPQEAISKCAKAGIMRGYIDVKGEEGELDMVVYEDKGYCGHTIKAKLGDLLRQPDYGGDDYESNSENATVVCSECDTDESSENDDIDMSRHYVTGLCTGNFSLNDGKFHNHCVECPGFGTCVGDYRLCHCDSCGGHNWEGGWGRRKWQPPCDNRRCKLYKEWKLSGGTRNYNADSDDEYHSDLDDEDARHGHGYDDGDDQCVLM